MDLTNLSYEEGLKELESIIDSLETGELTLEESFNKFKKGVDLYKYLYEILNKVEGEIKIIMEDEEREEDFQLEG
ncbi:exodeoxyribonuclease VII small subunit [Anaerosalibacter bizertensis]|uniref:Exodeoxyribonuclease 7 small subunit n=1 Tax=Anaerosalibacter bizertensis TaxID=932217 RepID=A0A844FFZ0_9FIRM|nr:exodeoxyribonuclease VII small subunit [Anaerosalibacter bizertensis]MBV1817395.1 exodeoxyribonuclease VII small subunit [Bacteroidales bacterium MSK.15.36]HHV26214.1 exodeoxyribonuclease VII small subunit [Tissierellia bacterium]MBU5293170.1 exodeoxyribonuclease VII small subunit [Anaerosalibacter bizertensis]MCB5558475.1 exodeoxyribonuclease VII small subunit [Anaerosalibacter bizertensis]MCG4564239.1 exodeoxyribonuclease VII small subunit [Anaerosalibacter bizertensis]